LTKSAHFVAMANT